MEEIKKKIEKSKFADRIYRVLLYISVSLGVFFFYLLFSFIFYKEVEEAWFVWLSNFFVVITAISISVLIMDSTLGIATFLENKYYNFKARNMMDSYRRWVLNSKYGDSYRILDYLNTNSDLTSLIQNRDKDYREQQNKPIKMQTYINDLRYDKNFQLYNDVILELSKKSLLELKNLLSFLELTPKKNWFFALVKTILLFLVSVVTFDSVSEVLLAYLNKRKSVELSSLFESLKTIILEGGISFTVALVLVFILLFTLLFLLVYKDKYFDEPHVREYLIKTITRAIEIKENGEETESF